MQRCDVAIVGYGPAGVTAANLLGQAGVRTAAFERAPEIYDLPRAVHFDDEIMRIFHSVGLSEAILPLTAPLSGAEFVDARGRHLFGVREGDLPPSREAWTRDFMFYQPRLERELRAGAARFDCVDVHLAHEVEDLEQDGERVVLRVRDLASGEERPVEARFALGCDGASSTTRKRMGMPFESLGFDQAWLVVDAMLRREVALPGVAQQICDPARVTTFVPSAGAHRRWEFQLLPGETAQAVERPEKVQELLSPWLGPDDAEIVRAVAYEFHALIAPRFREGRVLLLGDAAHQMPPFLGQGMCAGMRDAANLAWKLVLVLRGDAPPDLLDTYQIERGPHVRDVVTLAVAVGRLIDAVAAAAGGGPPVPPGIVPSDPLRLPPLRGGLLHAPEIGRDPVGRPIRHPRVRVDGAERMLDDVIGSGFALLAREEPRALLSSKSLDVWERLGGRLVDGSRLEDDTGILGDLFADRAGAIVRPDRIVYGTAERPGDLDALTAALAADLQKSWET